MAEYVGPAGPGTNVACAVLQPRPEGLAPAGFFCFAAMIWTDGLGLRSIPERRMATCRLRGNHRTERLYSNGLQLLLCAENGCGITEDKLLNQAGRDHRHTHAENLLLHHRSNRSGRLLRNTVLFHEVPDYQ